MLRREERKTLKLWAEPSGILDINGDVLTPEEQAERAKNPAQYDEDMRAGKDLYGG